ncbi:nitrile hydratase subunit beta [Rhodococcus koreensis]
MIGIHDMGGFHHLGDVHPDDDAVFGGPWQERTFAMQMVGAANGLWTSDEFRHVIERMPPAHYLETEYFQHWLTALEELFTRHGIFTRAEWADRLDKVRSGTAPDLGFGDTAEGQRLLDAMIHLAHTGAELEHPAEAPAEFAVGQRVRAVTRAYPGHTRCPRYIWEKTGTVLAVHAEFAYPETTAARAGENPERVYSVRFDGRDLWGEDAEPHTNVTVDLWQSYLSDVDSTGKAL